MGKRGEGWVALQFVLFGLILLAPTVERFSFPIWLRGLGVLILLAGGLLGTLGVLSLGRSLSPFPKPVAGGRLVNSGIYGWVRHPIYSGLILGSLGWSLLTDTVLGLLLVVALFVFFDLKSRREERWLCESYPEYGEYQKKVRKLIPGLY